MCSPETYIKIIKKESPKEERFFLLGEWGKELPKGLLRKWPGRVSKVRARRQRSLGCGRRKESEEVRTRSGNKSTDATRSRA